MNKIILVHYLAFHQFTTAADIAKMRDTMRAYHEKIALMSDQDIVHYVLPLRGEDVQPRIECINPKLVSGEEYAKAVEVMNKAEQTLKEWIASMPEPTIE